MQRVNREDMLNDLLRVYNKNGKLTRAIYQANGIINYSTIQRNIGWNNALIELGIETNKELVNKEQVLEDLIRVYNERGKVTKDIYAKFGKYSCSTVRRQVGNWNQALKECGLDINCEMNISDEDLLADLVRLYDEYGQVTAQLVKEQGKYSITVHVERFGFTKALILAGVPKPNEYGFSKSADIVIKMYEQLLGEKAEREKQFDWLVNPKTGRKLFIDAYFPNANVCLEYNGEQHYREMAFGRDNLSTIQYRDEVKYQLIRENGHKLIIVRYDEPLEVRVVE